MTGPMGLWCAPPPPAVFERLAVISPHFDDAVLGCGQMLAAHPGALVVTVTGGERAAGWSTLTDWDALAGFRAGQDVVAARRAEELAALAVLEARSRWLPVVDHQYAPAGARPTPETVAAGLAAVLAEEFGAAGPTAVLLPMGLANPDHVLAHDAARQLLRSGRAGAPAWFGYAEAGYLHIPGLLAWRLSELADAGIIPTPLPWPVAAGSAEVKRQALACYRSQLRALAADWGYDPVTGAAVAESHWRLDG